MTRPCWSGEDSGHQSSRSQANLVVKKSMRLMAEGSTALGLQANREV